MKPNKHANVWWPQPQVLSLIIALAVIMGGIFSIMLSNLVVGMSVGLAFAGALYLVVVVNARRASKGLKKHHPGSHRGRM